MDVTLPNNCYCTEIKVTPKNWDKATASVNRIWKIHYTFYDPTQPKGFRVQAKGMNGERVLKNRQLVTKKIIETHLANLMGGYNPFTDQFTPETDFEVNPYTPFIEALWIAIKEIKVSTGHMISMKSHLRGVEKSAIELNIHRMPLKDVTMKYFNRIFSQCYKNNPRFTGSGQNRCKKTLHRIYKELFKMEAVEFNPLALIERVRAAKRIRVMPTDEERKKISSFLKENYYPFWRAMQLFYHSGAREAEFMRLQAKDVNLKAQEVAYTIEKGVEVREGVTRPIKNSILKLWKEIMKGAKPDDYLFARGMKPGPKKIREDQFHKYWRRHVKGASFTERLKRLDKLEKKNPDLKNNPRHQKTRAKILEEQKQGLKFNIDLYTLKHLNTTEVMDELDKFYNPAKDVAKMNAHNEAMVISIYDTKNKGRKDEKIKSVNNKF